MEKSSSPTLLSDKNEYEVEDDMSLSREEIEAMERNNALTSTYGKLPSYAYFTAYDIGDEKSCQLWWDKMKKDMQTK